MINMNQDVREKEVINELAKRYDFINKQKLKKFLKLTLEQKVKTNKASKKLRINYSNAKVIVRKEKVIRQSIKTESSLA